MSRLYNTFEFVGHVHIPKNKEKFHEVKLSDSGWEGHRLNFAIQESKTNSVFLELYGGFSHAKPNKIISFSKGTEGNQGSKIEIPWEDRLKDETVDMVADFKKIVVDFTTDQELKKEINELRYEIRNLEYKDELTNEEKEKLKELKLKLKQKAVDRKEFIHMYDVIKYLSEKLEDYTNNKFRITGRVEYQEYNNKFYRKFVPEFIEIVDEDTPSKLRATMDIFFTKDCLDERDFEQEKKIYIDGYVLSYDGNVKKDQFFPQQFVLNAQKVDFNNEQHVKRLEYLKKQFNVKGKGVYHLQWEVNIFRGADEVEFTYDDLTPQQKEAIEFGFNKLEDFKPKGGMLGETREETRLVKPILMKINDHNDFSQGAAETTYTTDDLEFIRVEKQKPDINEVKEETSDNVNIDLELDDLFA